MKNKILALDSNIFIYHFEANPQYLPYTTQIFSRIINKSNKGISSIISLIETLSYPAPEHLLEKIEENFKTLPNFTLHEINQEIAIKAAEIRRTYNVKLPHAIQLATAIYAKADVFITNDAQLKNFPEVKVKLLQNT